MFKHLKKDVLIITNYYPPEIGAASNRIHHLAEGLSNLNYNVEVLTPLPNYPTGKIFKAYKGSFKITRVENNTTVHRLWIYASNSKNKFLRLFAMLSYSMSLIWYFLRHKLPRTIIIQSPPLLVAFTCLLFLNSKKHKLILNVSDLWPIAGLELGAFKKNLSYKLLEKIERFNYKKAHLILGQSQEIISHIASIFPEKETFLYRNFPDFEPLLPVSINAEKGKLKMVYAGLLGIAQGVFKLMQHLDYTTIEFHIYGSGAERVSIENYILKHPDLPIFYHGEVSREQLHEVLVNYDFTVIPLLNRIYGSVPSKIFEYARLGLPMLYFGGGEGEALVKKFELGWVAEAANYTALNVVINGVVKNDVAIDVKTKIAKTARAHFDFKRQLGQLSENL